MPLRSRVLFLVFLDWLMVRKNLPMGYIYEAMDRAKEAFASAFGGKEERYNNIFEIID